MFDPSQPLPNAKHERFAVLNAGGITAARSYQLAWRPDDPDAIQPPSARSNGYKIGKQPAVAARIAHLRKGALEAVEDNDQDITRDTLAGLMDTVTDALMAAADAAAETGAPPRQQSKIRKLLTTHAGRAQRLKVQAPAPGRDFSTPLDLTPALERLRLCACP